MTWTSKTLADTMPSVFSGASKQLASAQKELAAIDAAIAQMQGRLAEAQNQAAAVDELVNSMASSAAESGIYYLKLASDTGSWNERVLNATGAPPRDANAFTAIVCTIVLTTSSEGAENAVTAIKDAATKVFEPPKPRIKLPPVAMPPEPPPPELPEPEEPPENEWKSVTVADIFPGVRNTTLGASSKVARIVEQLSGGIEDFQAKKQDLEQLVSETQSLVDTLASTGTYAFLAAPETTPSADWYERMTSISEENGRPPFNPSLYSSGTVTVVTASNYFELLSRFSKITSAINTSI